MSKKVIVVTGGAGLLGSEICRSVSSAGNIAIVADINLLMAQELSKEIPNSFAISIDINCSESITKAIESISKQYGKIDCLVNNAYPRNKEYGTHFFDVNLKSFNENVNLNIGGYFLTSQLFSIFFKKQTYGNIVNVASVYGVCAPKFSIYNNTHMTMPVEYSVIKSGIIHLTKYMASYFKGLNIRVNCVSPGGLLDGQPAPFLESYKSNCLNKGMLNPTDITGAINFLISDESTFINGQNIIIDDGFTL